ncbi:MAG TPA: hypothetical protein DEP84_27950 [Chloroflexi bacterium]|nr:hypothetical protein [Chloroflexota bacterium]
MKFGFGHVPAEHYRNHVELVQLAENLGYDFAWIPDQTFFHDPYAIMAALALATDRIQIGMGVTNPYTRNPGMAARGIATVDEMSNGRAHLGVGAGNRKELLNPLGLDSSHAGPKCREFVEVVRALLSGEVANVQGKYYQAVGVRMDIETRPDILLYIAGRGPYVLQAAGEVADGVIIGGLCTPKGIEYAWEQVRKGATRSGRDPQRMEAVSWVTIHITEDREAALRGLQPVVAHIIGGAPMEVLNAVGLPRETVEMIKSAYVEGIPQAAKHVTEECIDTFTIVGDAGEVARRIRTLERAGVTQVSVLMPPGTVEQHKDSIRTFADAIFPAFR